MELNRENFVQRILVVDDDSLNRKYYLQVLKKKAYELDEAASGEEALEKIAEQSYDLVLTDLQMFKVDGLDVLHAAKEKDPNIQVVILTGYASIPTAVNAMKQGAFDYLSKPVNKQALLMRVEKALYQREMQRHIEEQNKKIATQNMILKRDLELAEKVQDSLVPSSFEDDQIAVGFEYHPMIGIGGDFCGISKGNSNRVNINIIDVTGHGIAAALIVNRVNYELWEIMKADPSPSQVLSNINSFFYNTFGSMGLFLTMVSMQLDFNTRELLYAGGAHPAALLFSPRKQTLTRLPSQNTIIGFQSSDLVRFEQDKRRFEAGDRLVLYTDGILEAENEAREQFGLDGLKKSLQKHIIKPVRDTASSIIQDVRRFASGSLRDDILLLVIEVK